MTFINNLVRTFTDAVESRLHDEIRALVNSPKKTLLKHKLLANSVYAGKPPKPAARYVPVSPGVEYLAPDNTKLPKTKKRKRASG